MAYIGREPQIGNFQVCDAISVVNGQAAYTMQVSSVNVSPESANHMLVSLNGILQKPNSSFTISGSTITFASNLATGDVIDFIILLGNVLDLGVPSDATVTDAKANFVSTSSAAGLQIKGDGTTDGTLQLNCSQNSHGIKLKSPAHSAGASYTLTFPTTDGNNEEFLQTNGSGVLTWASAGGAFTLLSTTTISTSTSSVAFNSSLITSSYRDYYFTLSDIDQTADSATCRFFMSSDNGSSYISSGCRYVTKGYEDNNGDANAQNGGDNRFELTPVGSTETAGRTFSLDLHLRNPLSTTSRCLYFGNGATHQTNDRIVPFYFGGYNNDGAEAINNVKFEMSSGNFDGGVFKIYGIT